MLQVNKAMKGLHFMIKLVQPSKFELHHVMEEDVLHNDHHEVDEVEGTTKSDLNHRQGCLQLQDSACLRCGVHDLHHGL